MNKSIDEIADIVNGQRLAAGSDMKITSATIDSRLAEPGSLFFALPGTKHDGHDFVASVLEKGGAAVVNRRLADVDGSRLIKVADVAASLQDLARYHRLTHPAKVIAVTGSVGKTTTKDMLASLLGSEFNILKSEGNYNNELGLPLTILRLEPSHQVAVVEMGMRGPGQIAELARIAAPDIAIITNIAPVHLELLGSLEAIAGAKCEVLDYLAPKGFALINGDLPLLRTEALKHDASVYCFGRNEDNEIRLLDVEETAGGLTLSCRVFEEDAEFYVPVLSESLAINVLPAVAVSRMLNISWTNIGEALRQFAPGGHRLRTVEIDGNITIIDDCYNANPLSMIVGLQVLNRQQKGRSAIAVLGDMMELGELEEAAHLQVGREAADRADQLLAVGPRAEGYARGARQAGMPQERIHTFASNQEAIAYLNNNILKDAAILVKGSRSMQMEEIVAALTGRMDR